MINTPKPSGGFLEYGLQINGDTPWIMRDFETHAQAANAAFAGDVVMVREISDDGQAGEWRVSRG